MLDISGFSLENEMRAMKLFDTRYNLLYKISHKDLTLIIRKLIL
jgi:hypothetical protein